MLSENLLPEDLINRRNADVYQRLDGLIKSYEEVIRQSVLSGNKNLNYYAKQLLSALRSYRKDSRGNEKLLEILFESYDEQLFRLCLREHGGDFVTPEYLPPSVLI